MEPEYQPSEITPIGKKQYFCVEYPGYVKRTERAIESMGGLKKLTKAAEDDSSVELRFRPTDMFSHPINGHVVKAAKLLVKVTRRVKKVKETGTVIEEPTWKVEVEGVISKTLRFRGIIHHNRNCNVLTFFRFYTLYKAWLISNTLYQRQIEFLS